MTSGDVGVRAVQIARGWIGTPYLHQASCLGAGCDCLGLIRGVWRGLYGGEPGPLPGYTPDWSEASGQEVLRAAALRYLQAAPAGADPAPGDVLLFRMRAGAVAKHLGLQSAPGRFIHAYERCGVVETALTAPWARRIVARFRFP